MGIPVSLLLLTGCTVNAPVSTDVHGNQVDIYDNTVQTPDWKDVLENTPSNPMSTTDPNAPQNLPNSWSGEDVEQPEQYVVVVPGEAICKADPTIPGCN